MTNKGEVEDLERERKKEIMKWITAIPGDAKKVYCRYCKLEMRTQ